MFIRIIVTCAGLYNILLGKIVASYIESGSFTTKGMQMKKLSILPRASISLLLKSFKECSRLKKDMRDFVQLNISHCLLLSVEMRLGMSIN